MNYVAPSPVDFHECGGLLDVIWADDFWVTSCTVCGEYVYLDDSWQVVPVEKWAD